MMRRVVLFPLLVLVFVSLVPQGIALSQDNADQAKKEALKKEVLAREEEYQQATQKEDYDAVARIWDDDLVYTNELGEELTKAQLLDYLKAGKEAAKAPGSVAAAANAQQLPGQDWSKKQHFYTRIKHTELIVRIYGDTAVLTAYSTNRINDRGRWSLGPRRLTRVWSKQPDGHWDQVVRQPVLIVQ
jgi:ketosteroid isomerase-like protein